MNRWTVREINSKKWFKARNLSTRIGAEMPWIWHHFRCQIPSGFCLHQQFNHTKLPQISFDCLWPAQTDPKSHLFKFRISLYTHSHLLSRIKYKRTKKSITATFFLSKGLLSGIGIDHYKFHLIYCTINRYQLVTSTMAHRLALFLSEFAMYMNN